MSFLDLTFDDDDEEEVPETIGGRNSICLDITVSSASSSSSSSSSLTSLHSQITASSNSTYIAPREPASFPLPVPAPPVRVSIGPLDVPSLTIADYRSEHLI